MTQMPVKTSPGGVDYVETGGLLSVSVQISATAVTTLHSAPSMIVPTPGLNKLIVPRLWVAQYVGGTANFSYYQGADPILTYGASANKISAVLSSGSLLGTLNNFVYDAFSNGADGGILLANVINQPVLFYQPADFGAWGEIGTVSATGGHLGTGYGPGDLFHIDPNNNQSSGDAIGVVLTVNGDGGMLTGAVTGAGTDPGTSYTTATAQQTTVATGSGDGALQVDITVPVAQTGRVQIDFIYQIIDQLV